MTRRRCSIQGCDRAVNARGYCHAHYERIRRGKAPGGPFLETLEERFLAKTRRDESGCWIWTGATDGDGRYGAFYNGQKVVRAHRWSYERYVGQVPPSMDVDHLCRVTLCVNPEHMDVVTHRENVLRGRSHQARNARKTHCIRGHDLSTDLASFATERARVCGTCARARNRAGYLRNKYGLDLTADDVLAFGNGKVLGSLEIMRMFYEQQEAAA